MPTFNAQPRMCKLGKFSCLVILQLIFIAGVVYKANQTRQGLLSLVKTNYGKGASKILEYVGQLPPADNKAIDTSNTACPIPPQLEPWHESVLHLLQPNRSTKSLGNCEEEYPLLFESTWEERAIFPVKTEEEFLKEGYDSCCYKTVDNPRDGYSAVRKGRRRRLKLGGKRKKKKYEPEPIVTHFGECFPLSLKNKTKIPERHEFISIKCGGNGLLVTVDVHAFVHPKLDFDTSTTEDGGRDRLNVVIFGLASVSRMSFIRSMPRTRALLMEELGAVEMTGYNKIADVSYPNLVPMLTSQTIEELNWTLAADGDNDLQFLLEEYSKEGYSTSYSEDDTGTSLFKYLMPEGFNEPPGTHYYPRPIARWAEKHIWFRDKYASCYGPRLNLQFLLNYMEKYVHVMSQQEDQKPFLQFTWAKALTRDHLDRSVLADDPLHKSLKWLKDSGHLNNTLFVLMSDHGLRMGKIRSTVQGRLEDLLPFMYLVFPDSFKEKYQRAYQNLVEHRNTLFTTFDMYETLKDILHLEQLQPESLVQREQTDLVSLDGRLPRGISRFLPIPPFRTCEMAGIPQKYCSCSRMESVVDVEDPDIRDVATVGVAHINSFLPAICAHLKLEEVTFAQLYVGNGKKEKGMESYLVNFGTKPGGGQFEAVIIKSRDKNTSWKVSGEIERTNRISQTKKHCSVDAYLPFCLCKY